MIVKSLKVRGFRNISDLKIDFERGIHLISGSNGQGKTTILEALSYLSCLRSFRGAHLDEVIQWGLNSAEIACLAQTPAGLDVELKISFSKEGGSTKKVATINGKPYRNSTLYLSQRFGEFELGFHSVAFNPIDHTLIRGEPALRRQYLDRVISAESLEYLETFSRYQKVLSQRNACLKSEDFRVLEEFTEPLAELGSQLIYARLEWIKRAAAELPKIISGLVHKGLDLGLSYESETDLFDNKDKYLNTVHFSGQEDLPSLEILKSRLVQRLEFVRPLEQRLLVTRAGPHRDDFAFWIRREDRVERLKGHGSQGEIRSALLALKLCELKLFRDKTGHLPTLLVDDFSSELDLDRRGRLLRFLSETDLQVFVTSTEFAPELTKSSIRNAKRFEIEAGFIKDV